MVFANLTEEDKEAFFALLDEYFSSRPELADALQVGQGVPARSNDLTPGSQAASVGVAAAHGALANNPQATSAAISAGFRNVPKSSPYAAAASNPEIANAVGRVAAASLAFNRSPQPASSELRPPPPPRRTSSSSSSSINGSDAPPQAPPRAPPRSKAGPPGGLVTQRKLGDIDTSSGKNMFWGVRNKEAPTSAAPVPSALASSKSKPLAPPPRRMPAVRPRTPTPEPESEPEYEGEWAEALYDFTSQDPNDLHLQAEQRVLVTERTSDDWWTGEVDGKSGLFPATYVKVL